MKWRTLAKIGKAGLGVAGVIGVPGAALGAKAIDRVDGEDDSPADRAIMTTLRLFADLEFQQGIALIARALARQQAEPQSDVSGSPITGP